MFVVAVLLSMYIYILFFFFIFYLHWSAVLIVGVVVRYNVVRSLNVDIGRKVDGYNHIHVHRLDRS